MLFIFRKAVRILPHLAQ